MDIRAVITSRKYAQAFLNLFIDSITPEIYSQLVALQEYLRRHRNALIVFSLPHIPIEPKLKLLDELGIPLTPYAPLKKLFEILIKHDRAQLAPEVLNLICEYYRKRKNIISFEIQSSHELNEESVATIKKFLAHSTGKTIMGVQHVNTDLIAGLRMKSDTLLWEYSIRKQMNELAQTVKIKGYQ